MTETGFDTVNTGMESCAVPCAAATGRDIERHEHVRNSKATCSRIAAAGRGLETEANSVIGRARAAHATTGPANKTRSARPYTHASVTGGSWLFTRRERGCCR